MAISGGPDMIQNGLVLSLDAADRNSYPGSGTTWRDLSGNNNSGSLINGPTYDQSNQGSIVFDGTNDYVQYGSGSGVSTDWTITVWFYPTSVVNYKNVIDCNAAFSTTIGNIGPRLEMNTVGTLAWIWSGDTTVNGNYYGILVTTGSIDPLQANSWYSVSITRNSSNVANTYMNGIIKYNTVVTVGTPSATFLNSFNNINIGRGFVALSQTDRNMIGRVASVQIYNRVLSATEVLQNYNATKTRFNL